MMIKIIKKTTISPYKMSKIIKSELELITNYQIKQNQRWNEQMQFNQQMQKTN